MTATTARNGKAIDANVDRLHRLMEREDLAALVVRGGLNVTYLAGVAYHGTLARHLDLAGSQRGAVVIWPLESAPILVVDATASGASARASWIDRLEVFDGYQEALFERVARVLTDISLDRARIGFDKNYVGAGFWEQLAGTMPSLTMVDSSALLDEVRWIKTDTEIVRFRAAARTLDRVLLEFLPRIQPGEREREAHARIIGGCLRTGCEFAHGILNSHRNPVIYCGESDFILERGDVIRTDYVAYVDGYPGHQSRNAILGPPSQQQAANYQRYREIYTATAEQLRPGVAAGEIYDFVVSRFNAIGWRYTARLAGHSVGPWWHQQEPIFCHGNRVLLEPGMVVALEPFVDHWHCQDLFLINEDGSELLSAEFDTRQMLLVDWHVGSSV